MSIFVPFIVKSKLKWYMFDTVLYIKHNVVFPGLASPRKTYDDDDVSLQCGNKLYYYVYYASLFLFIMHQLLLSRCFYFTRAN